MGRSSLVLGRGSLGSRQGQFREPGQLRGFGMGYPHPDHDHYAAVANAIPAPSVGSEGGGGAAGGA